MNGGNKTMKKMFVSQNMCGYIVGVIIMRELPPIIIELNAHTGIIIIRIGSIINEIKVWDAGLDIKKDILHTEKFWKNINNILTTIFKSFTSGEIIDIEKIEEKIKNMIVGDK